jgi:hypothetical protein
VAALNIPRKNVSPATLGVPILNTLEDVLRHHRADAATLRRRGHDHEADVIESVCSDVERTAETYLRWLSEDDAMLRSGRGRAWLKARFPEWQAAGDARQDRKVRRYRMIVIPERRRVRDAQEAGRRAGKEAA